MSLPPWPESCFRVTRSARLLSPSSAPLCSKLPLHTSFERWTFLIGNNSSAKRGSSAKATLKWLTARCCRRWELARCRLSAFSPVDLFPGMKWNSQTILCFWLALPDIRKAATCPDSGSRSQRHKPIETTCSKSGSAQDTDWFAPVGAGTALGVLFRRNASALQWERLFKTIVYWHSYLPKSLLLKIFVFHSPVWSQCEQHGEQPQLKFKKEIKHFSTSICKDLEARGFILFTYLHIFYLAKRSSIFTS